MVVEVGYFIRWSCSTLFSRGGMNKKVWFFLLVIFLCSGAYAENKEGIWDQKQLNESYMRSLSKDECMIKTIKTLKTCKSDDCIKTMAGILGDCLTWSSGEEKSFCSDYEEKYIRTYCPYYLDDKRCLVLHVLYDIVCKQYLMQEKPQ
jgi:hypothetical protein